MGRAGGHEEHNATRAEPALVELWAALRESEFGNFEKLDEARRCTKEMREWFAKNRPEETWGAQAMSDALRDALVKLADSWDVPTGFVWTTKLSQEHASQLRNTLALAAPAVPSETEKLPAELDELSARRDEMNRFLKFANAGYKSTADFVAYVIHRCMELDPEVAEAALQKLQASCGPSQAAPGTVAAEEDTVGNRSLRSSSAQELTSP